MYGKPTLLLRFGKHTTCLVSLVSLIVGNLLLLVALAPSSLIVLVMEGFVAAIGYMLLMLWTAEGRSEQVAIGTGARMGNGLLILILGLLVLEARGASLQDEVFFALSLTLLFALGFVALASRPDDVVIGYKG